MNAYEASKIARTQWDIEVQGHIRVKKLNKYATNYYFADGSILQIGLAIDSIKVFDNGGICWMHGTTRQGISRINASVNLKH